jgi:hypothetical protein
MDLGPLYHWSPRTRIKSINKLGLVPRRPAVSAAEGDADDDGFRQDGVCFSADPATAWAYSHAVFKVPGTYDLWQVWLEPNDEVHVLPMWGDRIIEVRVMNRIHKRRLRWVGERTIPPSTTDTR